MAETSPPAAKLGPSYTGVGVYRALGRALIAGAGAGAGVGAGAVTTGVQPAALLLG